MITDPVIFLNDLFKAGLEAADPLKVVPPHLPPLPKGRIIVIGAGKASAAMAKAVEESWPDAEIEGLVVTQHRYAVPTEKIEIIEAAHPVPDDAGEQACTRILQMVESLSEDDLVLCLISGGGSALLSMPAPCLSSEEKREINKALLKSGATIHEMNSVRKHLSAVKGGRLALAAQPAKIVTLIISDVPGDDPSTVASGPTLPDATTQDEALAVIDKYNVAVSDDVRAWLSDPENETPDFEPGETKIVARAQDALFAAASFASSQGVEPIILGDDIEGEARKVGDDHVQEAFHCLNKSPVILISGGETTVTIKGNGKGGRNTEYLLAATIAGLGHKQIYGIACDTDGIDGSEDNAGALFTPNTLAQAKKKDIDPAVYLNNNDAYSFFEATGDLIITGPTFTNVNDFRAILVL